MVKLSNVTFLKSVSHTVTRRLIFKMGKRDYSGEEQSQNKKQFYDSRRYISPDSTYYRNPITEQEAQKFDDGKRRKPFDLLQDLMKSQKADVEAKTVIHWFREDLRISDNTALCKAIEKQQTDKSQLVTVFTINKHDWIAHLDSNFRLTFLYNALKSLHKALLELSIPLYVIEFNPEEPTLSNSTTFAHWFKDQCLRLSKGKPLFLTANAEYPTDELYRDIKIFGTTDERFQFNVFHDTCIVEPCIFKTQQNIQYSVFSPWYKKWCAHLMDKKPNDSLVATSQVKKIQYNEKAFLPDLDFQLPAEFTAQGNVAEASEEAAISRLRKYLEDGIDKYPEKDILIHESSSHMSAYLSVGVISARTVVNEAFHLVPGDKFVGKSPKDMIPMEEFIREVAWRDFYKHTMSFWPYLSMDLPFNLASENMKWINEEPNFEKWCYGKTGVPVIDAIMRKLLLEGYINNRARMITASFLSKNLLIDWRWGERWFRNRLIDCDLASNVGGWGFLSSTGVDAQPYFRVFNMERQSQAFDPDGEFIKRWVPELKDAHNVHSLVQKAKSYPEAIVDLKGSRQRALDTYSQGLYQEK
ncbi:hypothetical protein ZYGR_0C00290 [Zygosaccharomyces rouxii]|uniref:Photolyase/cryptochrome alpha/beta domain-containing protein n=1 Tax=Zygosaccharomyces rouxii TaxID=4956 RepID=A0A1Q2ZU40_ZYGRO|nr:hypothetical protein ZYGR_0C00290 [Zygosaccharomyces rouxii]